MDTDDFSEMAWSVIVQAAWISDTLKSEIGALSTNYKNEDDWLRSIQAHLLEILDDPIEYLDYWNLEIEEGVTVLKINDLVSGLYRHVNEVLSTPLIKRGNSRL